MAHTTSNSYVLKFEPEIARALAEGRLEMMKSRLGGIRASAIDAKNTIRGNASLVRQVSPAMLAVAAWQVLAVVTAQKFLSEINTRLASIEKSVGDIKVFLDTERWGKLNGSLRYLRVVAQHLDAQDFTDADTASLAHQLESIDRESAQIMEALHLQMERPASELQRQKLAGMGLEINSAAARSLVDDFAGQARCFLVAAHVRCVAAQMRCALPMSRSLAVARVADVREQLARHQLRIDAFHALVEKRAPELKGVFTFYETDDAHRKQLRERVGWTTATLGSDLADLFRGASQVEQVVAQQAADADKPLALVVTLDDEGKIKQVQKISGPASEHQRLR